jgi:membrane protein DedA with SNARE-associated domain
MLPEGQISAYGYYAVEAGTFFEGETVLVLAGFAAHRGYLELPLVIACAFAGETGSVLAFDHPSSNDWT